MPRIVEVGFATFYLREEADIWWATVKNMKYEPGFGWREFKDMLRNRFYPVSVQKAKEDESIRLQQGRMTVLEYASKFMELSRFALTCVADEKLKMNRFKGLTQESRRRCLCDIIHHMRIYTTPQ